MKQNKWIYAYSIVMIVTIIIGCLLRNQRGTIGTISLVFILISVVLSLILTLTSSLRNKKNIAAVIPVISFGMSYFLLVLLVSLILGMLFHISSTLYLIFHIMLLTAAMLISIGLISGKDYILHNNRKNENVGKMLKHFIDETALLKQKAQRLDDEIKTEAEGIFDGLIENFRYADPMSHDISSHRDDTIAVILTRMSKEIDTLIEIKGTDLEGLKDHAAKIHEWMIKQN